MSNYVPIEPRVYETQPICSVCGRRKAPCGRDVPSASGACYCHAMNCEGYNTPPYASAYWIGEEREQSI